MTAGKGVPQKTWNVGGAWDQLLAANCRISAREKIHLSFKLNTPLEKVEVIADGRIIEEFSSDPEFFSADFSIPPARTFRVRGTGKEKKRKYEEGSFTSLFLLNPLYRNQ